MVSLINNEYLVTGQGYEIKDPYKQTILLYDTFNASSENDAKSQFNIKYSPSHKIINIYSAQNLDQI